MVQAFHEEVVGETHQELRLLLRLVPFVGPQMPTLIFALVMLPVTAAASLLQPYLLKEAIDAAVVDRSIDLLLDVVSMFALTVVAEFCARFAQTYSMQYAGQKSMAALRRAVFDRVQHLPVAYFDRTPVGRLVTRITNDVDSLSELFASGAITAIADLITLVGIVGFMLYIDWRLSLLTLLALPPLVLCVNIFRRFARRAFREQRLRIAQLNAFMSEQVSGLAVVQAFSKELECLEEYKSINGAFRDANHRAIRFDALLYSVVQSVSVACVAIILFYAANRANALGDPVAVAAYVGTVIAFYEYIQRFFIPIRDLATKYTIIQSSIASAERIFSLLDVSEVDAPEPRRIPDGPPSADTCSQKPMDERAKSAAAIAFQDVCFEYRAGHPVLQGIDLTIRKGTTVAIVGPTGSGKTTLTSLLLRFYDVTSGRILIEGTDHLHLDRAALRKYFSVVQQDVFLFAGTVLDNIAMTTGAADPMRARQALQHMGAWEWIQARGGLDALVDERGSNFSAGQRQLLAFARALYRDAPFLILDEATANIDSQTESSIQQALERTLEGRTAIIIAHRLSTIRRADEIIVLRKGEIVERGSHHTLLQKHGVYKKLYELQFANAPHS